MTTRSSQSSHKQSSRTSLACRTVRPGDSGDDELASTLSIPTLLTTRSPNNHHSSACPARYGTDDDLEHQDHIGIGERSSDFFQACMNTRSPKARAPRRVADVRVWLVLDIRSMFKMHDYILLKCPSRSSYKTNQQQQSRVQTERKHTRPTVTIIIVYDPLYCALSDCRILLR